MSHRCRSFVRSSALAGVLALGMLAAAATQASAASPPRIGQVRTEVEGPLVYLVVPYSDADGDAVGFGFRGINGSGWAEESHPFSDPSYGRVTPGQVAYPFNHECGGGVGLETDVEFWIYDATGSKTLFRAHLTCQPSQFGTPAACVTSAATCDPTASSNIGQTGLFCEGRQCWLALDHEATQFIINALSAPSPDLASQCPAAIFIPEIGVPAAALCPVLVFVAQQLGPILLEQQDAGYGVAITLSESVCLGSTVPGSIQVFPQTEQGPPGTKKGPQAMLWCTTLPGRARHGHIWARQRRDGAAALVGRVRSRRSAPRDCTYSDW